MRNLAIFIAGASISGFVIAAGCGGSSNSSTGTGATTTSSHAATSSSSGKTTSSSSGKTTASSSTSGGGSGQGGSGGAGGSGAGGAATNPFECTVPSTPPSAGSCVTTVPMNDAGTGIQCNPVTNAPCGAGSACDTVGSMSVTGFMCYPPPNNVAVCGTCDDMNTFCVGGATCLGGFCGKYCCTNADCGAGTCTTMDPQTMMPLFAAAPSLGLCTM